VVAAPLADGVPVLPGVWVDTAPCVVPGVVGPEVDAPPEDDVPDEVCASAAVAIKLSANVATIAVLMDGQRCNHGIVPVGRHAFAPALSAAVQSTPAPIFAN
jgi:hypothetical protein